MANACMCTYVIAMLQYVTLISYSGCMLSYTQALALHTVYSTVLCYAMLFYTMLYYAILCNTILCYTMLYYTILYYTILYYTIMQYNVCSWLLGVPEDLPTMTETITPHSVKPCTKLATSLLMGCMCVHPFHDNVFPLHVH